MAKRDASCPLCGAKLLPTQVLDTCDDLVDVTLGVLGCHCPYCQGYFEVMPGAQGIEIGYLQHGRFDVVLTLAGAGLVVLRDTVSGSLRVRLAGRDWKFSEPA